MNMNTKRLTHAGILLTLATVLLAGGRASAATYASTTVTLTSFTQSGGTSSIVAEYDGTTAVSRSAGLIQVALSSVTPVGGMTVPELDGSMAFCMEVESISLKTYTGFSIVDLQDAPVARGPADTSRGPIDVAKADYIRELWGRYADSVTDTDSTVAFQLSIWELVYEDYYPAEVANWDLTVGEFTVTSASTDAMSLGAAWLSSLDGTGPKAELYALSKDGNQDIVVEAVPEPATMSLLLVGGLGLLARRGKRQAA